MISFSKIEPLEIEAHGFQLESMRFKSYEKIKIFE